MEWSLRSGRPNLSGELEIIHLASIRSRWLLTAAPAYRPISITYLPKLPEPCSTPFDSMTTDRFQCRRRSTSAGLVSPLFELAKPLAITIVALLRPHG